jgi:hypothetical protein
MDAWGLCFDFDVEQFVPSDRLIKAIARSGAIHPRVQPTHAS